eukprot:6298002-Ditylum_brightwellii.AAC.1
MQLHLDKTRGSGPASVHLLPFATLLILPGKEQVYNRILTEQGLDDHFLFQLKPEAPEKAVQKVGQKLTTNNRNGYDHGYFLSALLLRIMLPFLGNI